jgi:hypothetical protein
MIWQSGKLDLALVRSIVPAVVKDRQGHGMRNLSCQPGATPGGILKEIVERDVYEHDYRDVTSKFIYRRVEYSVVIASLIQIMDSEILPNHIPEDRTGI